MILDTCTLLWLVAAQEQLSGRARSTALPMYHRDPADRIIVATAQATGMPILTPDPLISGDEEASVIW